jgi:hypothetical protein
MVKASNLIKKLLPIGLVIGGLLLLSQSKRVNIFKTTVPPEIKIQPTKNIPIIFDKLVPVPTLEPDSSILFNRYGQLYTKSIVKKDVTKNLPTYAQAYYGSGQSLESQQKFQKWLTENRTYANVAEYSPIFSEDDE